MSPKLTSFATREALMAAAAARLSEALQAGLAARGAACAALSGGNTPGPAYALLAQAKLDWTRVTFALVDERFAPKSPDDANEAMLRRTLAPALAQGARLLPMASPHTTLEGANLENTTLENAAARADALYARLHFDIALMGMGADGHTASWFPGAQGLNEALDRDSARTIVAVRAAQAYGSVERLTLTYAAVSRADRAPLLITGLEKRARLSRAHGDGDPVAALFQLPPQVFDVLWAE